MLLIIKFIEGIYYIRQTNPLHPLSTSNGLLIIPELINYDENESSDVIDETNQFSQYKSILIDVNIERNEWYELMDFCLNQKIPKPDILIVSHLHLDHCCHSHEFVKIFDGMVVFPTSEMMGITSNDGHAKIFQIPDNLSISAQEIANSFQYLKDILGFDIISDPEKIIPYDLGETFNFGCVKISSIPLKAHSPGHSGFLISIPEKNSGDIDFIIHSSCLGLDRRRLDKPSFGPWFAGIKEYNIPEYFDDIGKINKIFRETALIHTNSHGLIYSKIESNNFRYFNNDKKDNSIVIFSNDTNGGHKIDEPFNYIRDIFQRRAKKVEDAIITLGYSSENIQKMMNNPKEIEYLVEKLKKFNIIFKIENFPEEMRPIYLFWERLFLINHIKYFIENYKN